MGTVTKAISLHQPWATLIAEGFKGIETRGHDRFKGLVGKRIAIHASKTYDVAGAGRAMKYLGRAGFVDDEIYALYARAREALGMVVCTVTVVRHRRLRAEDEPEALCKCAGSYGLILDGDVEILKPPVPAKGGRGIWHWKRPEGPPGTGPASDRGEAENLAVAAARSLRRYVRETDGIDAVTISTRTQSVTLGKGGGTVAKKADAKADDDKPAAFRKKLEAVTERLRLLGGEIISHAERVEAEGEYTDSLEGAAKAVESARMRLGAAKSILRAASNIIAEGGVTGEQTTLAGGE